MCNCIKEKELFLHEEIAKKHPNKNFTKDGWKDGFQNKSFLINHNEIMIYNEFKMEYTFTKRNGEESVPKNLTAQILPSYCCFCGEKLEFE